MQEDLACEAIFLRIGPGFVAVMGASRVGTV
jgi:hypothetical protein